MSKSMLECFLLFLLLTGKQQLMGMDMVRLTAIWLSKE